MPGQDNASAGRGIEEGGPTKTIVEAIERHARVRPDAMAMTFLAEGGREDLSITFAEVLERAGHIAGELRRAAPSARRVMVLQAPGLDFVLSLCACFLAGVAAVPTPPPAARASSNSAQRFARLFSDAAPDAIVTSSDLAARAKWLVETQIGLPPQNWVMSDLCGPSDDLAPRPAVSPRDLALIQYTSGSTAEPKGVMIDHANLAANLAAIQTKFELTPESVVVNWLPPYHDMGLIGGIIEALWGGYRVVLMDPKHFVARPLGWLEAIDRYRADVSGGANFAYELCADALERTENAAFDLSCWRLAFSGAEPVRVTTIDRFTQAFAAFGFRRDAFYPCYGLAEATLMASGPALGGVRPVVTHFDADAAGRGLAVPAVEGAAVPTRALVSCGTPCQDLTFEIVDPDTGQALVDGREGEIRISGPSVMRGYWREQADPGPGLLATGDLGFFWQGGLYVTGRLKDLIIIRGRNVAPADVENAIALCHPALAPAAAAAFSVETDDEETLVVAAEIRREYRRDTDWADVFAAMQGRITNEIGMAAADLVLLRPGGLARTTSGKIRRRACRQAYVDAAWTPLARMADMPERAVREAPVTAQRMANANRRERLDALDAYLQWRLTQLTALPAAFLGPDTPVDEVGLDSLKQVEFVMLIERDLGVSLPMDWSASTTTLSSLADLIRSRRDGAAETAGGDHGAATAAPGSMVPLSPRQAAFFAGTPDHPDLFMEVLYFRTPKGLDVDALHRALAALVAAHDAFSLRFFQDKGAWQARVSGNGGGLHFERIDIADLKKSELAAVRQDALRRVLAAVSVREGPLVSAVLLDRGAGAQGVLAVGFHHLAVDAVSLSVWATQLQDAYRNEAAGRSAGSAVRSNGFIPWLLKLNEYGASDELAAELDYWRSACGVEDGGALRDWPDGVLAWRSMGKTTLPAADNGRLLETYRTPVARNAVVLAALAAAWIEETGDRAPLIMTEGHGRHPFPGTQPMTAVGWFAARYPVGVPVHEGTDAGTLVQDVTTRLSTVPNLGVGYDLLRRRPAGDPLREDVERLRRPGIFLQYRGNIDETFRPDAVMPIVGVYHEGRALNQSLCSQGDVQPLSVTAGLSDGILYWSIFFTPPVSEDRAQAISDGIRRFLIDLASR